MKNKQKLKEFKQIASVGIPFYFLMGILMFFATKSIGFVIFMFLIGGFILYKIYRDVPEERK